MNKPVVDLGAFTATERKILRLLMDGEPHRPSELRAAWDTFAEPNALHCHIVEIRRKLPEGVELICVVRGRAHYYRLMRVYETRGSATSHAGK